MAEEKKSVAVDAADNQQLENEIMKMETELSNVMDMINGLQTSQKKVQDSKKGDNQNEDPKLKEELMNQINDTETSLSDMDKAISDLINAIDAKKKSLGNK